MHLTKLRRTLVVLALALAAGLGLTITPAAAASPACVNAYYPDGRVMVRICHFYTDLSGSAWLSNGYDVWNPTVAYGGHSSDVMFKACTFNASGDCTTAATDGATVSNNTIHTINDAQTLWLCFEMILNTVNGTQDYHRQVSFTRTGLASVAVTATCGPAGP